MAKQAAKVTSLTLSGFRAYLDEQSVGFRAGSSLVVFAPNGKGKSSLVDAFEFVLSTDGTVTRLGEKKSSVQGGREALLHHGAEARGITPFVQIDVQQAGGRLSFKRSAKTPEALSVPLAQLAASQKVPFIIRGFELRRFVEEEQPKDRYESVARWFGFEPLLRTQDALRAVRLELRKEVESKAAIQGLDRECGSLTGQQVANWNEGKILAWYLSKYITPLDSNLTLTTLNDVSAFEASISAKVALELPAPNLTQHKSLVMQLRALLGAGLPAGSVKPIEECLAAFTAIDIAQAAYDAAHIASANAVFNVVWAEARKLLDDGKIPLDNCPVCETPFAQTAAGSREELSIKIGVKLEQLSALKAAESALAQAKTKSTTAISKINDKIIAVLALCDSLDLIAEKQSIQAIKDGLASSDSKTFISTLEEASTPVQQAAASITAYIKVQEAKTGQTTWKSARETFDKILSLKERVDSEVKRKDQLYLIQAQVTNQSTLINQQVKAYVDTLIGSLSDLTNFFYKEIQSGSDRIPKVHLVLPPQDRQVQHALELVIDFADNRRGVAPGGYLSDSQVHTLALSLRFAAITLFNKDFPLTILDDVVTSYDSDFRATIAGVLAKHFKDQQLVVVTHDEQFFNQLQDHLSQATWAFKRIMMLDPTFGPKYAEHRVHDQQIEDEHNAGKEATNKVRQAEEDWLTEICRDFGVDTRIREINFPYRYSRSELAAALYRFLSEIKRRPPAVAVYQNPFLITLQRGTIENMGSHFTDNPHAAPSLGDEKQRWGHFKEFRSHFVCQKCGKSRFKRPEAMSIPVCKGCETQFSFRTPTASANV